MALKQILFRRNYPDGYKKISAIKEPTFIFGDNERVATEFGIVKLDVTGDEIYEYDNYNKWCVNETEDGLVETPEEYQKPEIEEEE